MLPKQRRINKDLFKDIFKQGYSFNNPSFSLRVLKMAENGRPSAFSFIVSLKVANLAVKRNFLKRRGKYAINKNINHIKEGFFCVFLFKKDISSFQYQVFEEEVLDILRKASLLK